MSRTTNRAAALAKIAKLQTWINDPTRTENERECAARIITELQKKEQLSDEDLNALHDIKDGVHRLEAFIRSDDHFRLAQACAALMECMLVFHRHTKTMEFIGNLETAVRGHWLYMYLDQQLEEMNPRKDFDQKIFGGWYQPEDFYYTAIQILIARMEGLDRERRRRRAAQTTTCTALVIYRHTGASLEQQKIREDMNRQVDEVEELEEEAPADEGATGEQEHGRKQRMVMRDPEGVRAAQSMFIPMEITIEGGVRVAEKEERTLPNPQAEKPAPKSQQPGTYSRLAEIMEQLLGNRYR